LISREVLPQTSLKGDFMRTYSLPETVVPLAPENASVLELLREPSVVHSSYGRLRVHLPHWTGTGDEQIATAVRRLPGVIGAHANPLTGNVLIRFEPHQTGVAALLEALPALCVEAPVSLALLHAEDEQPATLLEVVGGDDAASALVCGEDGTVSARYVTGTRRIVYIGLGWTSVGMAVVGAIVPGIPTTPFVILAGYFFVRSSPEAHAWLLHSRGFGPILRDWETHRGVRRWIRNAALGLIGGSMAVTVLLPLSVPLKATIVALQALGIAIVLRVRVVDPASALAPSGATV
jgi:uncharacterized membrane protein YbaN (DUF454 family)